MQDSCGTVAEGSEDVPAVVELAVELHDPALDPEDPLNHHILTRKFPLVRRGITLSNGNC